ncbi:MAG: amylo-alpha-1,6-glucosidase [Candidatus Bathyarchaeia archaeon]|jgi:predicted glycogen debranching enzyme
MKLPALTYSKEAFERFGEVLTQEWLVTNGLGSYASSTVPAINTRKYHGLLVAALNPPGDRTVCLSKLDEDIIVGSSTYRLGANDFLDTIFPDGFKLIKQFTMDPYPTYRYEVSDVALQRTLFMPKGKNAVAVLYHVTNRKSVEVKVRIYPIITCRYYHTVIDRKHIPLNFTTESTACGFQATFTRPDATLACRMTDGKFIEAPNWIEHIRYREESLRGEAAFDDCYQLGYFELTVPAATEDTFAVTCAASADGREVNSILALIGKTAPEVDTTLALELKAKEDLLNGFYDRHPRVPMSDWLNWVLFAADSFIVQNVEGKKSIIAGYHWFEPWGRDTFISLPGLLLVTGRFEEAKGILQNYVRYLKDGMIPNFVADRTGVPVYNTVDGTLWYVNAVFEYLKYTGDYAFVKSELWPNLKAIIEKHQRGTMFGIRLDSDGLLSHGPRLTWMDAVVGGDAITPREGKAVEIQALWYNTLKIMEFLANQYGEQTLAEQYLSMSEQTRLSFNEKYWNPKLGCLYDVLEPDGMNASLRPNQVFAVSLNYAVLNKEYSRRVVDVVDRELVTPYGLRTLSLEDPKFVGRCFGDRRSRDSAYHNGTIWPWLLGPYITAYVKVNDYMPLARKQALRNYLLPLFTVGLHKGGLGSINEIYDCDAPNAARGCISQAWSVAEPLRAYIEDVLQVKPKFR